MKTREKDKRKDPDQEGKKPLDQYVRYSAIGFQMAAIIGGGTYLGYWLDKKNQNDFPIYTLILALFSIFAALYLVIRDLLRGGK